MEAIEELQNVSKLTRRIKRRKPDPDKHKLQKEKRLRKQKRKKFRK